MTPEQKHSSLNRIEKGQQRQFWTSIILGVFCFGIALGVFCQGMAAANSRAISAESDINKEVAKTRDELHHLAHSVILLAEADEQDPRRPESRKIYSDLLSDIHKLGAEIDADQPSNLHNR